VLINTLASVDCYVGRIVSVHRTWQAADAADTKLQRLIKRNSGQSSYLPTIICQAKSSARKGDLLDSADTL
jgi:hypothetical protein